jgi:hypothetical protein
MAGVRAVRADTILTPPVGAYDPNTGHIAVKVLNRDAQPQENAIVTVNGASNRTLPTNTDGCAFFAFLPAGTYTVRLGTTGYVDRQSNATPQQTLGVTVGVVSSVQFDYDQAASIAATIEGSDGGTVPNDLAVVLANAQYLPNGRRLFTGTGPTRTIANLFPALDGYEPFAGECADADPEGIKVIGAVTYGPYWPGATRASAVAPAAGTTANATITIPTVSVVVHTGTGDPVVGATVVASHAADNICASGVTHTLGTTDVNGELVTALPYGTWTITVTGRTAAGAWPQVVVDPNASEGLAADVGVQ